MLSYTGTDGEHAPTAMMWNTFLAHKLLGHALDAGGPEAQTRLKLALFKAHFSERRNVSDPVVLLAIAQAEGLDRRLCDTALADPAMSERVRAEEAHAWDLNISGVPAMLVQGKFLIPGAQEPEVYANALRRVVSRLT